MDFFFAFNRLKTHFLRMQLTSSVHAYSYHMVHINVYGLFYFYVILYTMHAMYISAICILLVNRNSLKTGRSGRSRNRPVYRESTVVTCHDFIVEKITVGTNSCGRYICIPEKATFWKSH